MSKMKKTLAPIRGSCGGKEFCLGRRPIKWDFPWPELPQGKVLYKSECVFGLLSKNPVGPLKCPLRFDAKKGAHFLKALPTRGGPYDAKNRQPYCCTNYGCCFCFNIVLQTETAKDAYVVA